MNPAEIQSSGPRTALEKHPVNQIVIGKRSRIPAWCRLGAILAGTGLCSSTSGADSATAGFSITLNGQPQTEIVVETKQPDSPITFAAQELQRYVKEMIKNMRHFPDRCPEADVIDLWHTDSETFCHCVKCTRGVVAETAKDKQPLSVPADAVQSAYVISYIEFVNRVAEAIAMSHPKVMVGPLKDSK